MPTRINAIKKAAEIKETIVFQIFSWKSILIIWNWLTKNQRSEEVPFSAKLVYNENEMELRYQGIFCATKAGNTPDECEDAYKCSSLDSQPPWLFAISDGATESSFSREWAEQLVESFVREPFDSTEAISDWLAPIQQKWLSWLSEQELLWFAKRKVAQGTYATLLGLRIDQDIEDRRWKWQAVAIGDSCLFIVRHNEVLSCFPLSKSDELNNTPHLIGSLPNYNNSLNKKVELTIGIAEVETHFYLVTDALAGWIFRMIESCNNPWNVLNNINRQEEFIRWLEELRESRKIRNDDTTMLHLYLD